MATFYLLPPRSLVGARFADFLRSWFPGTTWAGDDWPDLGDMLGALAGSQEGIYVVFREDLPAGEDPLQALADAFGAEPGDEVVEIHATARGEIQVRRRNLRAA